MPTSQSLFLYRGDQMSPENMLRNDKAVSVSVGFMLMFAITVLVFTGLIISFYTLTQNSEKSAMRESFKILGEGLAIKITTVDTLINMTGRYSGTINTLEYEFSMPESIAAKSYSINITNSTNQIIMESDNGARIAVPFSTSVNFTRRNIYSGAGNYVLRYINNSIDIEER